MSKSGENFSDTSACGSSVPHFCFYHILTSIRLPRSTEPSWPVPGAQFVGKAQEDSSQTNRGHLVLHKKMHCLWFVFLSTSKFQAGVKT